MTREPGRWRDLEVGAPEIARRGGERLSATGVALLGTLRRDASPRISPIQPSVVGGELLIGTMPWSRKTADLQRDPRYVLHSTVTDPDSAEGEFKIYGSAIHAEDHLRRAATEAWWASWPHDSAVVYCLRIYQSLLIEWDTPNRLMTVHRWSPEHGYGHFERSYP